MNCRKIQKKISMLEQHTNEVDYPNEVMNKKIWTYKYMNELFTRSVNGARSPKAIAHLKKVCKTIQWTVICLSVAFALLALVFVVKYFNNSNSESKKVNQTSKEQNVVICCTDGVEIMLLTEPLT